MINKFTLFGGRVGFHVLVEGGRVDEGFLALGALELFHSSMGRNVGSQVGVYGESFS